MVTVVVVVVWFGARGGVGGSARLVGASGGRPGSKEQPTQAPPTNGSGESNGTAQQGGGATPNAGPACALKKMEAAINAMKK